MTQNPRFALFGANGFIGARLVREIKILGHAFHISQADIRDTEKIRAELENFKPTHVINAAAKGVNPFEPVDLAVLQEVNVQGALNLQKASHLAGAGHFIHLGSCSEYGSHASDIEESFPVNPETPYAQSKAEAANFLLEAAPKLKCATMVLRLFGTWGPGEKPHRLVPHILASAKSGKDIPMTQGGQIRDFSFVDDMAADIVALSLSGATTQVVNVGSGRAISVLDFALHVARILKCENRLRPGALPQRPGEADRMVASTRLLSTLIQLKPRTSIEIGLRLMR